VREAKERGQTIFLSSHILSEVEALCDRIGILRAGRLVDEGTLANLRHLSAATIEVTFAGPPPELPTLPGITVAGAGTNALRFEVTGSVGPLIAALASYPVVALTSREPSLEEIFLHQYETSDGRSSPDAPRRPSRDGGTELTGGSSNSATGRQPRHDSAPKRRH
jgi:ABC-2 type transport system ATP-binding protein